MIRKSFHKSLGISLLMLAVLMFGQAALAQSAPDNIEMIGIVEAVGDGTITVNGQTVQIGVAEITVALSAGQIVKIEGTLSADGNIIASEVQSPDNNDPHPGEIELTGQIESIDGDTITVNGIVIDLSLAEIEGVLEVGATVKIHASRADDGTLVAREAGNVMVDDGNMNDDTGDDNQPGEFEITGTLDEIGDSYLVVNGQRIEISGAEIKNALVPGALVKLHLSNQDGQLVAREVENALRDAGTGDDDGRGGSDDNGNWDHTYTVRPGDTLSSIAARAGVTVEELALMNGITDTSLVVVGAQLQVPDDVDDGNVEDINDDDANDDDGHVEDADEGEVEDGEHDDGEHEDDGHDDGEHEDGSHNNSGHGSGGNDD